MHTLEHQIKQLYLRNCGGRTDPAIFTQEVMDIITNISDGEKRCVRCNASTKRYWHKLTPGLVSALVKINKAVNLKKENDIRIDRIPKDIALTHVERCNWQKLRLHGLIARVRFFGQVKRGRWLITRKGFRFLHGKEIPSRVLSFRNRVVGHSDEMTTITDVVRSTPYFESIEDIRFEYPEPKEEGELEIENVPIFTRSRKLKKGQIPCPRCGSALTKRISSEPSPTSPNSVIVTEWKECKECGYSEKTV